jgi:hypothetical protein
VEEMPDRDFWNEIISALDPELRELAERIIARIPESSILRSHLAERALGVLKSMAERRAKKMRPFTGAVVEKATDLFDFATPSLFGKVKGPSPAALRGWMNQFFNEASKRMAQAQDPQETFNRLQQEFELRQKLIKMLEQAAKAEEAAKAAKKPAAPIDWGARFQLLRQEAKARWASFTTWAQASWQAADPVAAEGIYWAAAHMQDWRQRQGWIRRRRPR